MGVGTHHVKGLGCNVNRLMATFDDELTSSRLSRMIGPRVRMFLAMFVPVFLTVACTTVSVNPYGIELVNTGNSPLIFVYGLGGGMTSIDPMSPLGKEIISYVGNTPSQMVEAGTAIDNTMLAIFSGVSGLEAILPTPILSCSLPIR